MKVTTLLVSLFLFGAPMVNSAAPLSTFITQVEGGSIVKSAWKETKEEAIRDAKIKAFELALDADASTYTISIVSISHKGSMVQIKMNISWK